MKNNRFTYNLKGLIYMLSPRIFLDREKILHDVLLRPDIEYIKSRVDYYCQLDAPTCLKGDAKKLSHVRFHKGSTYHFDTYEFSRYFNQNLKAHFQFGDVNYICPQPSFVKSRPIKETIADCNYFAHSTLLNLDKVRHFTFIKDPFSFDNKKNKLFYRGGVYQPHRIQFFEKYFHHHLCDLGHTGNKKVHKQWQKPKISIARHLPYKFILSLEGNDVASNLKWIMSSNSLAIMPKPKYETWFMEGRLIPNCHYVQIADDYGDVLEKMELFIQYPQLGKDIIHNAHEYVKQFFDKKRETIIALLVIEKYLYFTGQIAKMRI